ncbi:MAG: pyruvate:ferredoxin (flavodoxin) oxidoreductase [Bacilli bacterium]
MKKIMDGNKACALSSYKFTEVAGIYPITPATTMAETIDELSAKGEKNFFDDKVKVVEMQSEAGAIGTVHGLLQNGILASTYTASQGLLLMLPNMYKIAGELLPCVINVAARTIATHALSIMGDQSDIYSTRGTGFAILSSSSVQQAMDLTNIAYLSTIRGRIPFINFFDGFRTSHEYNKIEVIDYEKVKKLIDKEALQKFRNRSLDIDNPTTRGTNQGDGVYFQAVESRNDFYDRLPDIVNNYMKDINEITGKNYKPFQYYGDPKAKYVIVAMGSVCETIKEFLDFKNTKLGLIEVHLYRPFSSKYFLNVLPKTVKKIAVLDRTKEPGSLKEPLCLDVEDVIKSNNLKIEVCGGRYGLSSKNTNLNDIEAVYNYLKEANSNKTFTIGVTDDVTNLSLSRTTTKFKKDYEEMLIYGYGSDGMITTSKDILTIIGENTSKYVQGYFEYDSKKSGGVTKSHLRFSDKEIKSSYYVETPRIVVCSKDTYLNKFDMLNGIKEGGIFILNTEKEDVSLPENYLEIVREKKIKVYTINASKIAKENNIPNKISMIMEMVILHISNLMDEDTSKEYIIKMIKKNFSHKGENIVNSNINALEDAISSVKFININDINTFEKEEEKNTVFSLLEHGKPNDIKVSHFTGSEDGVTSSGLSKLEKRGLSNITPSYDKEKCIMCNLCSFVCPHAVIRPYLLTKEEYENAPIEVKESAKEAKIKDHDLMFTVGVSTYDCTGCSLCEGICPTGAIKMAEIKKKEQIKFDYLEKIEEKKVMNTNTVKGSQFVKPAFEFSGACAGCGETPYLKLLSQLFKDNLMVANATGCSSIYGASLPSTPWNVPWVNSLFEDNAEFGYGIRVAEDYMKNRIKKIMTENKDKLNDNNKSLVEEYLNNYSKEVSFKVYENLDYDNFKEIIPYKKYIKEKSIWLVGGDGWAYDIGFGGIDQVLSSKENVNILVLDTEVYSNTGGQSSKSTRPGAIAKFAYTGKENSKKDLARIAMCYPHVYVGTISLGANYMHTIKTILEAEKYPGPSILIAYAPCIAHGIKTGMKDSIKEEKLATESGYFPLFRYSPETKKFSLDSGADFEKLDDIFKRENRYRGNKELLEKSKQDIKDEYKRLKELSKEE